MSVFLAIIAALGIALIVIGAYMPRTAPDPVRARLSSFAERTRTLEEIELEQPFSERVLRPLVGRVSLVMQRFLPKKKGRASDDPGLSGLQKRLVLAGSPNSISANDFLGIIGLCMLGMSGLIFLLMGLSGADVATAVLVSLVGIGMGYALPSIWLSSKVTARQKEIAKAMPDALDLLVISVEAGLGFDAALQRVTEKSDHALSREFRRAIAEIRMGRPRREALKEMVNRTEVQDLNTFVSAIIQADQLGVSVSRVLTVQADQMRLLRRQRAEEMAAKAPLKMLFPMILLIFPSMFIVILGPSMITMMGSGGL